MQQLQHLHGVVPEQRRGTLSKLGFVTTHGVLQHLGHGDAVGKREEVAFLDGCVGRQVQVQEVLDEFAGGVGEQQPVHERVGALAEHLAERQRCR